MSNPPHDPRATTGVSVQSSQAKVALQQALLNSTQVMILDVRRFAHRWQERTRPLTRELMEIGEELLTLLDELQQEFSRPEGPSRPQVDRLLATLVGAGGIGPLTRLQGLAGSDPTATPPDEQRLLSETDTLFIELNGLRAQWQDYVALPDAPEQDSTPPHPPLPVPPQTPSHTGGPQPTFRRPAAGIEDEVDRLPPPREAPPPPPRRQGMGWWGEMGDLLQAILPILLGLVLIACLAVELSNLLPKAGGSAAPATSAASHQTQPSPTSQIQPSPTSAPPSPATSPQATTPPGPAQLSVSPTALALPCPATGETLLELTNTGAVALDWVATIISTSDANPGILLDGEPTESGHLDLGEVTQISVTVQSRGAQGIISIQYSGASNPIRVPYSVGC